MMQCYKQRMGLSYEVTGSNARSRHMKHIDETLKSSKLSLEDRLGSLVTDRTAGLRKS